MSGAEELAGHLLGVVQVPDIAEAGAQSILQNPLVPPRTPPANRVMPMHAFFIIEDVPPSPMVSTVAGVAIRAVEGCDLQIELVQGPGIAG